MEKFLAVLTLIGVVVMVFSIWNFISVRRHIKETKRLSKKSNWLSDQKYFELKNKQEFIVAAATIIFALITFLGYSTIDSIKTELGKQFANQKDSINLLNAMAIQQFKEQRDSINLLNAIANENYLGLQKIGATYQDSVRAALGLVTLLRKNITTITAKDIVNQNIFIVDPLPFHSFSKKISGKHEGYRFIKFNSLTTILGKRLPAFEIPPSIMCFSNNPGNFVIGEINVDGFYIKSISDSAGINTDRFNVWISQKPLGITYPPIANAGEDQIIHLPIQSIQLKGN